MPAEPPPSATAGHQANQKNENDEWRKLLIALLFLLFSFGCIFCSSQAALWAIDRDRIEAGMRSALSADYNAPDPLIALAPLDEAIAAEAAEDEARLAQNLPPLSQGIGVAILPRPISTPTLIPTIRPLSTLTPTPTSVPASDSSPPTAPPPTSPPPTAPPPTAPPPTAPPPTSPPPTSPPPTSPPPTSPPPTSPPPTSPPPTSPPPTPVPPALSISDAIVTEGDLGPGWAVFTVTLSAASSQAVSVEYATEDGVATAPADYTAVPTTTLSFPTGVVTRLITVTVQGNTLPENDKTFFVNLASPTNATISDGRGQGTIINDDLPTVDFDTNSYVVTEADGPAVITVTLSVAWSMTATVEYATNPGGSTAVIGSDYLPASGTLTFPPGSTSQTFEVEIIDDAGGPGPGEAITETVELTLSNAIGAALGTANNPATLTIVDDDDPSSQCEDVGAPPTEGGPNCQWTGIAPGTTITLTLTSPITADGTTGFDFVFFERESPLNPGRMDLDLIQIEVATNTVTGPWYQVFYWGDDIKDNNTNLGQTSYGDPPEIPNAPLPMTTPPLHRSSLGGPVTGIAIDLDSLGIPQDAYPYIRISAPSVSPEPAEVDAVQPFFP